MTVKHRKRTAVIITVCALALILTAFFYTARIREVTVEGNTRYSDDQIKKYIFKNESDKNIVSLWLKTKTGNQQQIPLTEKYDVEIESVNKVKITVYEKSLVGYVDYMGTYMYFDKDGTVVESTGKKIDGIPKVTGLDFDSIVLNEPLPAGDSNVFDMLLAVTQSLDRAKLNVDIINITKDKEVTLSVGNVKILLGSGKDMSEKISDLSNIAPKLKKYSGTLDMSMLDTDGKGYTLKKNGKQTEGPADKNKAAEKETSG